LEVDKFLRIACLAMRLLVISDMANNIIYV
jgi:hypothetical protein